MTAWPMADQWLGRSFECTAGDDTAMHPMHARVYHGEPGSGDVLILPAVDGLPVGVTLIVLNQSGANSWAIEQPDGTPVATVAAGDAAELRLAVINAPVEGYDLGFGTWTVTSHTVGVAS